MHCSLFVYYRLLSPFRNRRYGRCRSPQVLQEFISYCNICLQSCFGLHWCTSLAFSFHRMQHWLVGHGPSMHQCKRQWTHHAYKLLTGNLVESSFSDTQLVTVCVWSIGDLTLGWNLFPPMRLSADSFAHWFSYLSQHLLAQPLSTHICVSLLRGR